MDGEGLPRGVVIGLAAGLATHCAWRATSGGADATVVVEAACAAVLLVIIVRMSRGDDEDE